MAVTAMCIMMSGCEDRLDSRGGNPPEEGKPVDVTLRIGLADEVDAYDLSATASPTKADASGDKAAFNFGLQPSAQTRAGEEASLKPEALYNLEIRQYDANGTYKGGSASVVAEATIGSAITTTLTAAAKCQLVLVAWGEGNVTRLNGASLKDAQKISVDASWISSLDPTAQADMNKMPYMLHLKDVNVSQDGRIYSEDGEAIDIRLRLQRLAARLNVTWNYNVMINGVQYKMNQILLQSIPLNYNVIPAPDAASENTYPSLLDQFTTIQLKDVEQKGSYSCWIPANVRGTNPAATSLSYRIKSNAPTGSSYIDFQAVNETDTKKKLSYRVYLGGKDPWDFNLYGNSDYTYAATFTHTTLPNADQRVTIIDPIPASEENNNLVPTANCFMVAPGDAFCFDPYKYQANGNINGENATLAGWASTNGEVGIASVKVLWQTRENGDLGDPVIGVVNSATDHTNIVDIKKNDGGAVSKDAPLTAKDQGRIYCRVAPNTMGGNGLIAAYNVKGDIIWSWHIWVTDYSPASTGNKTILEPANKRKLKFTWNLSTSDQLPMMDRNLGAMAGYVNVAPATDLEKSQTNGLQYQWGRKDPFTASYSAEPIKAISSITGDKPIKGMLNRYGPDGLTYVPVEYVATSDLRTAYKFPHKKASSIWTGSDDSWGGTANTTKTVYDPCPAGWKVAPNGSFNSFFISGTSNKYNDPNISNTTSYGKDGGFMCYFAGKLSGDQVYIRLTGYAPPGNGYQYIGTRAAYWMSGSAHAFIALLGTQTSINEFKTSTGSQRSDGNSIRCIQEKAN